MGSHWVSWMTPERSGGHVHAAAPRAAEHIRRPTDLDNGDTGSAGPHNVLYVAMDHAVDVAEASTAPRASINVGLPEAVTPHVRHRARGCGRWAVNALSLRSVKRRGEFDGSDRES